MNINKWLVKKSFGAKTRIRTWKKIAVQIKHGLPFYKCIEIQAERAKRKKKRVAVVFNHILRANQAGSNLANSLVGWASPEEIMLIGAGEKKDLVHGLNLSCNMMENKNVIRNQVIGASVYPIFLLLMCVAVMCIISFILVPEFTKLLPEDKWEGLAAVLIVLANFVASIWGLIVGIGIVGLSLAIFFTLPVITGSIRKKLDKFPPWSIYREVVGVGWMFSVATLMSAGIQPRQIFSESLASSSVSPYLKERIRAVDYQMALGKNIGLAMQDAKMDFPSEEVIDDMVVYAELPDLEKQMSSIAEEQMVACIASVKKKMSILKTVLMFIVVMLILLVIMSIFSLQSSLGNGNVQGM